MEVMLVSVLAVLVIVQTGHHHGPTGAAACRGGERVAEQGAIGRHPINVRGDRNRITIATERFAFVIGDEEDDVTLRSQNPSRDQGEYHSKEAGWQKFHVCKEANHCDARGAISELRGVDGFVPMNLSDVAKGGGSKREISASIRTAILKFVVFLTTFPQPTHD